jgi:hypothetical protein
MSNRISVRFYSVEKLRRNGPSLKQALEGIHSVAHNLRQVQISGGYTVRLERYAEDAGEIEGEFTRVRTDDFPFEVHDDGVSELRVDGPLGHGVAFRYRPTDHTLAIQYDTREVSPGRAFDYIQQYDHRFAYQITPKLDLESWRKFNRSPVRKIRIGIASPQNLGEIEDEGAAVKASLQQLGEAYDAPMITIEMGMGRRDGALNEAARDMASAFVNLFRTGDADLRSLKGWVKPNDDVPAEEINLIDELLSDKIDFPHPSNDPDANYEVRRNFLKQSLRAHV